MIHIETRLAYDFAAPSDVLLQIEAAATPGQAIVDARLDLSDCAHRVGVSGHDAIGGRIWLRTAGRFTADYRATVRIERTPADLATLAAVPLHRLPGETVEYLMASRYCQSDLFEDFVRREFGDIPGGAQVAAMRDWIERGFSYTSGSSTAATTALESFAQRRGVCRDYAHVLVTLARAAGIPARVASVYALGVDPQDFHAVAEVFLDGAWHLVDPTGMARPADMAIIGVGRDAADVAFLTSYGEAVFCEQQVAVSPG